MKTNRFWKLIAVAFVVGLFYTGTAIFSLSGAALTPSAQAQLVAPSLTQDHGDVLITNSYDGKTLYIWTFGHRQLLDAERYPMFQYAVKAQ